MRFKQNYPLWLCLLLAGLFLHGVVQAAQIMCWTNKEGVRECGALVPPEYSQQRIEVINNKGQVIKVYPRARTKEELAKAAALAKKQKAEERRREEQRRRDLILLRTFTTERDLELSRKGKIDAIKGIIDITNGNTRSLEENLRTLQQRAADFERSGQKPPKVLVADMQELKQQIKDNNDFVAKKQKSIIEIDTKYDSDLARFRELKSLPSVKH